MKNIITTSLLLILAACGKNGGVATTHDGNFGDVAAADAVCASDANLPTGGGTYKALIGASTRFAPSTDWPLKASTSYVRSDGKTVIGTTTAARVFSFNFTV